MLNAGGMRDQYDPDFGSKKANVENMDTATVLPNVIINMAHNNAFYAKLVSSDFDRLFPHSVIEHKLNDMDVGQMRTLSGMMYVIYFDEQIMYQTNVTMNVHLIERVKNDGMRIRADINVVVTKFSYDEIENDAENEDFTNFFLVQQLINDWNAGEQHVDDLSRLVGELDLGNN